MPSDRETKAQADARLDRLAREWFASARREQAAEEARYMAQPNKTSSGIDNSGSGDWSFGDCADGDGGSCD